jgi:50S ribosomal subunit-associated GTPase HflX
LPVFNKTDRCDAETGEVHGGWSVSAKTGDGIRELKTHLLNRLARTNHRR